MSLQLPQFPQSSPKTQGLNWKAIIFWGIILGLFTVVVYHYHEPIIAFFANPTFDLSWFQNVTLDNILAFVQKYGILITGAAATFSFVYGLYKNAQTNKALQELASTKAQANSVYANAQQYQQDAEYYKAQYAQLAKGSNQDALNEAQNEVVRTRGLMETMQLKHNTEIQTLQNEIDRLKIKVVEKVVVK